MSGIDALGGDITDALERVCVPAYVIDVRGVIRGLNAAAVALVGDVRGRPLTDVVAPEDRRRAKANFARNLLGPLSGSENAGVLLAADGERIAVRLSAVPLRDRGRVIGVFGLVRQVAARTPPDPPEPHPVLTRRQSEVLRQLEAGLSTAQIASALQISPETVRNHVRGILAALNVHSRVEAIAAARQTPPAIGRRRHSRRQ